MIGASTFSGVGGMDLGLARAGIQHAFFAESDPWRRSVIAAHWDGAPVYDDVRDVGVVAGERVRGRGILDGRDASIRSDAHPPIDLLAGGFPCQDLSVAGRRAGLAGARSGLFHEFARIADTLRPCWILLENVPGLLSSNDGRDMGVVAGTLADLGYSIAWRVLDARYFGVPQRRRRVFIVGHLGDDDTKPLRALCEGCSGHPETRDCSWQGTPSRPGASIANALDRQRGGVDDNSAQAGHLVASFAENQRGELLESDTASLTKGGGKHGQGYPAARIGTNVRRLTPVECERLMGWPDNWTAPEGVKAPDSRRYAACGDGVVANVAEWIGRRILAEHHGNDGEQHH